jgi:hypothetical protein
MKVDQMIVQKLDTLIKQGEEVVGSYKTRTTGFGSNQTTHWERDKSLCIEWGVNGLAFLRAVFGTDNEFYLGFCKSYQLMVSLNNSRSEAVDGISYLKAAKSVYENGYLLKIRNTIEAEIFDDLLEQAEHLQSGGYYIPAAVLCGCVLEDALRKICVREGVQMPAKTTLNVLNDALAKAGVYNALTQKKVLYLAGLRNDAAHGAWVGLSPVDAENRKKDIEGMMKDVRRLLEEYL